MMLSIDIIPVPTDEAVKEVESRLLGVETNITNWQKKAESEQQFFGCCALRYGASRERGAKSFSMILRPGIRG